MLLISRIITQNRFFSRKQHFYATQVLVKIDSGHNKRTPRTVRFIRDKVWRQKITYGKSEIQLMSNLWKVTKGLSNLSWSYIKNKIQNVYGRF